MDFSTLLRENNLRATPGRLQVLTVLSKEKHPATVDQIREKLASSLDTVTLYRTLEALKAARLV